MPRHYWLFKSEPEVFSLEDLQREPHRTAGWDGIRNYQARNFLRDDVHKGDGVLFYHSNAKPNAVVGTATVVKGAYPDPTAFDPAEKYFDPKSDPENPRWFAVDVRYESSFAEPLTLPMLREVKALADTMLLRRGMRLSIQPVKSAEWNAVLALGKRLARTQARSR